VTGVKGERGVRVEKICENVSVYLVDERGPLLDCGRKSFTTLIL